jgi:hypothetical protein
MTTLDKNQTAINPFKSAIWKLGGPSSGAARIVRRGWRSSIHCTTASAAQS